MDCFYFFNVLYICVYKTQKMCFVEINHSIFKYFELRHPSSRPVETPLYCKYKIATKCMRFQYLVSQFELL